MSGPGNGEEIREGRTRAQARALNREAAAGPISAIGPCEGGRVFQALLAANERGRKKTKLPDCLVKEGGPEPTSIPRRVRQSIRTFGRTRYVGE